MKNFQLIHLKPQQVQIVRKMTVWWQDIDTGDANMDTTMEVPQASVDAIRGDIKAGHLDLRKELSGFRGTIKGDTKKVFRNWMRSGQNLRTQARMDQVVNWVAEVEKC